MRRVTERTKRRAPSTPAAAPTPRGLAALGLRPSLLARYGLFCYLALIVYASLYPFITWQDKGLSPWEWVLAPWPRYVTSFDIITNVLGYLPLGALWVWSVHPKWLGWRAVWSAALLGCALSFGMESLQTWLPQRVSSNLDWGANSLGALLGALVVVAWAPKMLERGRLRQWRHTWFEPDSSFALVLLLLWPFAQVFPQAWLLGTGDVIRHWLSQPQPIIAESLSSMWPNLVVMREALLQDAAANQQQQWWEAAITATAWLGAGLLASVPMRSGAPKMRLVLALLCGMLLLKMTAMGLQFSPEQALAWLTPGAFSGLILGTGLVLPALWLPRGVRALLAMLALLAAVTAVNLLPPNPYYLAILQGWRQGRFIHFNGLAQWLGWIWPFLAFGWLVAWTEARQKESRRTE